MEVNQLNQFIFPDPRVKLSEGLGGRVCADRRSSVDGWTSAGPLSSACLSVCLSKHPQLVLHLHLNPFSSFSLNFPQAPAACAVALLPVLISGDGTKTSPDTDAVQVMQANQQ